MSTHESCAECEKQRESLLTELFPEKFPSECGEWTLSQLQQIKKHIASRKKTQESIANSSIGQIGNSLLGRRMNDTGQPNPVNPGATIGNSLFGKRMNEL